MAAGRALNQSQFAYHYSPDSGAAGDARVASIKQHGLLTKDPTSKSSYAEESGQPRGVYMFRSRHEAEKLPEGHVWEVNVHGLKTHPDPWQKDWDPQGEHAIYSPRKVHPKRLTYLGRTKDQQQDTPW